MSQHQFKLEISETEMEAFLTVIPAEGLDPSETPQMPETDQIMRYLELSGIKYGINQKAVERLVTHNKFNETVQVAKGTKPSHGATGRVEFFFYIPREDGEEHQLDDVPDYQKRYVKKGDLLARKHPPSETAKGMTVTGRELMPMVSREIYITTGRNTYFSDDEDRELRASMSGIASYKGGTIHVDGVHFVQGSVDDSTGDIDFPGDVIVLRNVKKGRIIKAGGKIEVNGDVGDAQLISYANIVIKGDFKGEGQGKIEASGDVWLRNVIHQTVLARGSITVERECVNAHLQARETIYLLSGEGATSLDATAGWSIVAEVLGDRKKNPSHLRVAHKPFYNEQIKQIASKITEDEDKLEELETDIKTYTHYKNTEFGRELNMPAKLHQAQKERNERQNETVKLRDKLQKLQEKVKRQGQQGTIRAKLAVYPGVKITIGDVKSEIPASTGETIFKKFDDKIVGFPPE